MNRHYYKGKTSIRDICIFWSVSVLLHILLLFALSFDPMSQDLHVEKPAKTDYYEITEFPVPEDKETEPPEDSKLLAEKNRKVEKESAPDTNTKLSRQIRQTAQKPASPKKPAVAKTDRAERSKAKQENALEKTQDKVSLLPPKQKWIKKKTEKEADRPARDERKLAREMPEVPAPYRSKLLPEIGADHLKKKEDTIDLNTNHFKYYSYFIGLKKQIENVWHYPKDAAVKGKHGKLNLIFTVSSDGDLEKLKVLRSSGYASLDDEAVRAIKVAAPYHPFPKSWEGMERLNIKASFEYRSSRSLYVR